MEQVQQKIVVEDEKLRIVRSQNLDHFFKENQHLREDAKPFSNDMKLVGRIPFVICEEWSRECGANIGSKEFAAYVQKKLINGDFQKFRIKEA